MTQKDPLLTAFTPAIYDECLGPMFFDPYARDLAKRVEVDARASVLEIAAGTGILTRHLIETLPSGARLVVTDVNEAMLDLARRKIGQDSRVEWRTADAGMLPFDNRSFDAVVCQFGLMFFPDKVGALREVRRVLRPSGTFLFNVWGSLADNPIAGLTHETVASFFHTNPPQFLTIPFGLYDQELLEGMLKEAGFAAQKGETVDIEGRTESPEIAAKGLVFGTPLINGIQERGSVDSRVITHAVAARLAEQGGVSPMRLPMRALVFTATA